MPHPVFLYLTVKRGRTSSEWQNW